MIHGGSRNRDEGQERALKTTRRTFTHGKPARCLRFRSKDDFPVEVSYKDKRYVIFKTKHEKLMLQKVY